MAGWIHDIIPSSFDVAQHLSYFSDLEEERERNNSLYAKNLAQARANLAAAARAGLPLNKSKEEDKERIETALQFLKTAADTERAKELRILNEYKDELKTKFKNNKKIMQLVNTLTFPTDISQTSSLDAFYTKLTRCLNEIRLTQDETMERIKQLQDNVRNSQNNLHYVDKNNILYRFGSDMQGFVHRMTGEFRNAEKNTFTEALYQGTLKYINSSKPAQRAIREAGTGADIVNIVIAISADLAMQAQKRLNELQKQDFTELLDQEMDRIIEAYTNAHDEDMTELQHALFAEDVDFIKQFEQAGASALGIKIETESKKLEQMRAKQQKRGGKTFAKQFATLLKKSGAKEKAIKQVSQVTVSASTNIHGSVAEYMPTILHAFTNKIGGSAGADLISIMLGKITLSVEQRQQVNKILTDMSQTITEIATKTQKADSKERQEIIKEKNKSLQLLEEQLQQVLQSQKEEGADHKFFIYHDSLKLYKTIETTKKVKEFGGRQLNILWALDELYSFGAPGLPSDQDKMITIALNLASNTLGSQNLVSVEKLFSIFASIIMFDDVVNVAKDIQAALTQKDTSHVIHMYNLNGIFIPASMLLTYSYYSLSRGWAASAQKAAHATINTTAATSIISEHVEALQKDTNQFPHYSHQWHSLAEKIGENTTIKIEFFSAFLDFIAKLEQPFGK